MDGVTKTECVEKGINGKLFRAVMFMLAAIVAGVSSFYCLRFANLRLNTPREEMQTLL
jgi:hypothetical protein